MVRCHIPFVKMNSFSLKHSGLHMNVCIMPREKRHRLVQLAYEPLKRQSFKLLYMQCGCVICFRTQNIYIRFIDTFHDLKFMFRKQTQSIKEACLLILNSCLSKCHNRVFYAKAFSLSPKETCQFKFCSENTQTRLHATFLYL